MATRGPFLRLGFCAALSLSGMPAGAQYFDWQRVDDRPEIVWSSQTQSQAMDVAGMDAVTVRAAIRPLMGATPEDTRILHAGPGLIYAQARETWGGPHVYRSEDGGETWEDVWSQGGYGDDYAHNRANAVLLEPASGRLWVGTSFGLFVDDDEVPLPPSAKDVIALAADPADSRVMWLATDYTDLPYSGKVSGKGLLRRRAVAGEVTWEDVGVGLPGPISSIGFVSGEAERVYVRVRGDVWSTRVPEVVTPEQVGWTLVAEAPERQRTPLQPGSQALRVQTSYPRSLVVSGSIDYESKGQSGYPLAMAGLVYTKSYIRHGGRTLTDLHRSRDGGVSWAQAGGHSSTGYEQGAREVLIWDNREQVVFSDNGLPGVAATRLVSWMHHPLDQGTVYQPQVGRGHLYRSNDLRRWQELSAGLDPMLVVTSVVVDSLSGVYLITNKGTFRRQDPVRPFRIQTARVRPDTVRIGLHREIEVVVTVRSVDLAAGPAKVTARFQGRDHDVPQQPDGTFVLMLPLEEGVDPGFYGVTVSASPPDAPEARVSELLSVMVTPGAVEPIFTDVVHEGWSVIPSSGLTTTDAFSGTLAHRVTDSLAVSRRLSPEFHPFGFRLQLYAGAPDSQTVKDLMVNGLRLDQLSATVAHVDEESNWFRIDVPAEMLYPAPRTLSRRIVPAAIDRISFTTREVVDLDDIRLVPVGLSVPEEPATAVVEVTDTPSTFSLSQNAPNPFNASTTIRYHLPRAAPVVLLLYNTVGQRVRHIDLGWQNAGENVVVWDGLDDAGKHAATGAYFYRLRGAAAVTRKLMLLR